MTSKIIWHGFLKPRIYLQKKVRCTLMNLEAGNALKLSVFLTIPQGTTASRFNQISIGDFFFLFEKLRKAVKTIIIACI